jgi:hypothetical protein
LEGNDLDDSLFEVGLGLDGLGLMEIRERARVLRGKVRPERRLVYSMTVWRALLDDGLAGAARGRNAVARRVLRQAVRLV